MSSGDDLVLLLTPAEAAARLSVSRGTLYRLLDAGAIESISIFHTRRIPADALESYVAGLRAERSQHQC